MRSCESLYGLRVVSYDIMSNHFHVFVEVPRRPAELPSDDRLVGLVRSSLSDRRANHLKWQLERARAAGDHLLAEEIRHGWFRQMWDVSLFIKVLKQRFTQWYNHMNQRSGTLWQGRFGSTLVEGPGAALLTMASYVDLNPVRAGICDDPKNYRWSGYAEALAGGVRAVEAVRWLASVDPHGGLRPDLPDAAEALRIWRCILFGIPRNPTAQKEELKKGQAVQVYRRRISRAKALEVLAQGGTLPACDFLRCSDGPFFKGGAMGSKEFVEEACRRRSAQCGQENKREAVGVPGLAMDEGVASLFTG
jgi:REP element-mobilizing transposase RayT